MGDELRTSGTYVASLASAVMKGGEALGNVPGLLKIVLEEEAWRRFVTPRGDEVEHDRFIDFATTPPLHGIGADVSLLKRIVADDPEAVDLLDRALEGKKGNPWGRSGKPTNNLDNIQHIKGEPPTGTSSDAAIRRLRKHARDSATGEILDERINDLYEQVLAGDISPHAAAIEAGFRKRMISIPTEDAERAARSIRSNMMPDTIRELVRLLGER